MEPEGSLACSQEPATLQIFRQSNLFTPLLFLEDLF